MLYFGKENFPQKAQDDRSWTVTLRFPVHSKNDDVFVDYPHLEILGGTFDAKLTFE